MVEAGTHPAKSEPSDMETELGMRCAPANGPNGEREGFPSGRCRADRPQYCSWRARLREEAELSSTAAHRQEEALTFKQQRKEVHDGKVAHRHKQRAHADEQRDPLPEHPRRHDRFDSNARLDDEEDEPSPNGARHTADHPRITPGHILVVPQRKAEEGRQDEREERQGAEVVDPEEDLERRARFAGDVVAQVGLSEAERDEKDWNLDWGGGGGGGGGGGAERQEWRVRDTLRKDERQPYRSLSHPPSGPPMPIPSCDGG